MNRKFLYLIMFIVLIIAISIGIFISTNKRNLVTYFSATGTTQNIAEYIAEETNGKLIEIVPKEKSSSSTKSEVSTWIQDLNIK